MHAFLRETMFRQGRCVLDKIESRIGRNRSTETGSDDDD
jgi:hypothetical protein